MCTTRSAWSLSLTTTGSLPALLSGVRATSVRLPGGTLCTANTPVASASPRTVVKRNISNILEMPSSPVIANVICAGPGGSTRPLSVAPAASSIVTPVASLSATSTVLPMSGSQPSAIANRTYEPRFTPTISNAPSSPVGSLGAGWSPPLIMNEATRTPGRAFLSLARTTWPVIECARSTTTRTFATCSPTPTSTTVGALDA